MRYQSGDGTWTTYASRPCGGPSMIEEDNEGDSVRDYKIMRCDIDTNEDGEPLLEEYWAFPTEEHDDIPSRVYIGSKVSGYRWDWTGAYCDYSEACATEVGRVDNLLPDEVVRLCRKWLEGK